MPFSFFFLFVITCFRFTPGSALVNIKVLNKEANRLQHLSWPLPLQKKGRNSVSTWPQLVFAEPNYNTNGWGVLPPESEGDNEEEGFSYVNPMTDDVFPGFDEMYPGASDPEVIEKLKLERMIDNDRWQSTWFRDQQGGEWTGTYETYIPTAGSGAGRGISLKRVGSGKVDTSITSGEFTLGGVSIYVKEKFVPDNANDGSKTTEKDLDDASRRATEILHKETQSSFKSTDFRLYSGNQVVATAFTLNQVQPASPARTATTPLNEWNYDFLPEVYVAEVAIREGAIRTRCRYAYSRSKTAAIDPTDVNDASCLMSLMGFTVIRECVISSSPQDILLLLDEKRGNILYDPQAEGEPYVQLNVPGRLTLFFPRGIIVGKRQCMTIEWEGAVMRYQVDRCFKDLTGAISTLELTEVKTADSEIYTTPYLPVKDD